MAEPTTVAAESPRSRRMKGVLQVGGGLTEFWLASPVLHGIFGFTATLADLVAAAFILKGGLEIWHGKEHNYLPSKK